METEEWYVTVNDRKTRIGRGIYRPAYETAVAVLPKVRDEKLISEAEKIQKLRKRFIAHKKSFRHV